jgi:osmotically-inducible protein OsmY
MSPQLRCFIAARNLMRRKPLRTYLSIARAVVVAAGCCSMLNGCFVAVLGAGAAAGGYAMGQERGPGGVVSDSTIKGEINTRWAHDDGAILSYVDLNVFQGRVLLTGDVPTPDLKYQAVQIARQVKGVQEVLDHIHVGQRSTLGSNSNDTWILTRLRSSLTFDGNINSLNYSLQCVDGVVYILGIARSQDELDRVVGHARNIPNVVRVVSYIRIRAGAGPNGSGDLGPSNNGTAGSAPSNQYNAPVSGDDNSGGEGGGSGGGGGAYQPPPDTNDTQGVAPPPAPIQAQPLN